jgi:hypothetical protein
MPYPFEDNPLEAHILALRNLESEERDLRERLQACDDKASASLLAEAVSALQQRVKALRWSSPLEPRDRDVFLTPLEQSLREFDYLHPKPVRRAVLCKHSNRRRVVRTFRNLSKHLCCQCLDCGAKLEDMKKSDWPAWPTWPVFDEQLHEADSERVSAWEAARSKVFAAAEDASDGIPSFDWEGFGKGYEASHPKPLDSWRCQHGATSLRRRRYGDRAGDAVVQQCNDCGKHLRSVAKASLPDIGLLADFDELLKESSGAAVLRWHSAYGKALDEARFAFRAEIGRQIASGAIQDVDTSRFGTYYDTPEWRTTRERILRRDDLLCQCCGEAATCVHHITYERLGCENDLDLISLCGACHWLVHARQDACSGLRLVPSEIRALAAEDA